MRVLVITPRLGKFTPRTVKFNAHTSYLCSFLIGNGVEVLIRDCNWKGTQTSKALLEATEQNVDAIIIVCNNTLIYGERLRKIIEDCKWLRETGQISTIWLTGYMATSFKDDIIHNDPNAVGICDANGIQWMPDDMKEGRLLGELIVEHSLFLDNHPGITKLNQDIPFDKKDRLSLLSSLSCNAKCSFCAYNNGLGKRWRPREVSVVVKDIDFAFSVFGERPITFSDNDFLGNKRLADERVEIFARSLRKLPYNIRFSLNTRAECLTKKTLSTLANIGLTNITIGLESLHAPTLKYLP